MYFLSQTQQAYERTLEIPRWQKMSLTITKSLCSEYGIILICLTKAVLLHLSLTRQVVCPDKSNVSRRITVPLWYGHLWHWQPQVGKATRGLTKKVNYVKYSFCFKAVVAVIWIVVWIETWWFWTYVLHELAADGSNLLAECGTEHHDLLLVGCQSEDLLDITPHICGFKKKKRNVPNEGSACFFALNNWKYDKRIIILGNLISNLNKVQLQFLWLTQLF